MTEELIDPPEPEESSEPTLRAKTLKNRPLIVRPVDHKTEAGQDGKPWEFVECDVWVLDRSGVEQFASGVRVSWWKARNQIKGAIGAYIACRPEEMDDNSVVLRPLRGEARKVAEQVIADIKGEGTPEASSEPF